MGFVILEARSQIKNENFPVVLLSIVDVQRRASIYKHFIFQMFLKRLVCVLWDLSERFAHIILGESISDDLEIVCIVFAFLGV